MSNDNQHSNLFNSSGCIKYTALQAYADNRLPEKELQLVGRHIKTCPLCNDALDGISNVRDTATLPPTFSRINHTLRHRIQVKNDLKIHRSTRNQQQRKILLYAVAASFTILVGVFGILNYHSKYIGPSLVGVQDSVKLMYGNNPAIAENHMDKKEKSLSKETPSIPSPVIDEILEDEQYTSEEIDFNEQEATIPILANEEEIQEESIFTVIQTMPSFDGGDAYHFMNYVTKELQYPQKAIDNRIEGRVFIQFTVNAEGYVENPQIIRGIDPLLDIEALRIIQDSPKWKPGMQRGQPVSVQFTIPIQFRLNQLGFDFRNKEN